VVVWDGEPCLLAKVCMHLVLIVDIEGGMGIENRVFHLHKHGMYFCAV